MTQRSHASQDLTVVVYAKPLVRRICRSCQKPITLRKVVTTGRWGAFERRAAVLDVSYEPAEGGVRPLHTLPQSARHDCEAPTAPASETIAAVSAPITTGTVPAATLHEDKQRGLF
jgi:hypothetical protein